MKKYEYDIIILSGGFDPIHVGHVEMIIEAKQRAETVIVGVNTDEWLMRKKGYVFMPLRERQQIVEALDVDIMEFDDDDDTAIDLIQKVYRNNYDVSIAFGNGGDRKLGNTPEVDYCNKQGISVLWNLGGGKIQSSSELVKKQAFQKTLTENSAILENVRGGNAVDHPSHYNYGKHEAIDIIEDQGHGRGFCYGNAMKYLMRAPHKGTELEDLRKARWYIERLLNNEVE